MHVARPLAGRSGGCPMTSELDTAFDEAESPPGGAFTPIATQLADRVGLRANARAVFGDPVERDGVTVIPVAKVRYGFGGGGGGGMSGKSLDDMDESPEMGEGGGGGGGMMASPVGYIEITKNGARF